MGVLGGIEVGELFLAHDDHLDIGQGFDAVEPRTLRHTGNDPEKVAGAEYFVFLGIEGQGRAGLTNLTGFNNAKITRVGLAFDLRVASLLEVHDSEFNVPIITSLNCQGIFSRMPLESRL